MRVFLLAVITILSGLAQKQCSSSADSQAVYDSFDSIIPSDYELLEVDSAYINEDSCYDYLVALKRKNEEEEDDARPLLFVLSKNKGCDYTLAFRNDNALYSTLDGPYAGFDCFSGIELSRDSILIHYYGGMSTRWGETHQFNYDNTEGKFLLSSIASYSDNIYDEEEPDEHFENFDMRKIALDSITIFQY